MVGAEIYIDSPISSGKRSGMTPTGKGSPHLVKQKPWKHSSFESSGPIPTAARTVVKDD